jgi:nicastrin
MDSSAFFHDLAFGAENDVSGMVVVMAALEAMGELKRNGQLNANHVRPIVFAFFNGEEWDYIGSSKLQNDIIKSGQPIPGCINDADEFNYDRMYFLELRQVGLSSHSTFYGHLNRHGNMSQKNASSKLFDTLQRHAASLRIVMNGINEAYQLPPSSLQQFLKVPNSIAGVVITDHEGKFANR